LWWQLLGRNRLPDACLGINEIGYLPHPLRFSLIMSGTIPNIYFVAACTCAAGFTFGYDIGVISGVLTQPLFNELMGMNKENFSSKEGNIAAALQVGGFGSINCI
jgi:hypothetical protein